MPLRAGKACYNCRARKVKCDVEEQGFPCRNCRLDQTQCFVQKSRRGKRPRRAIPLGPSKVDLELLLETSFQPSCTRNEPEKHKAERNYRTHTTRWRLEPSAEDPSSPHDVRPYKFTKSRAFVASLSAASKGVDAGDLHRQPSPSDLMLHNLSAVLDSTSKASILMAAGPLNPANLSYPFHLPLFIKPLPAGLTAQDIHYLHAKGALDILQLNLRRSLVRSYVRYVHPFMPVLDLRDLIQCASETFSTGPSPISILVFQAVMFAGLSFLEPGKLKEFGFNTKREARKAYFHRTRLLYDLDAETDQLVILQTALLLTSWCESPDDNKGSWHWLGIAISICFSLGIQAKVVETPGNRTENRLRRRIWWACYMRDRMLALNMSRLMRIRDDEFNIPMLSLEDFEIGGVDWESPGMSSVFLNATTQVALAEMCIFMTKLCVPIGSILSLHFSTLPPQGQEARTPTSHTMMAGGTMLFPKFNSSAAERVALYDAYIEQLFSARSVACIYSPPIAKDLEGNETSILVNRAYLHMSFFAVVSALHRPQLKSKNQQHNAQPMLDDEAHKVSQKRFFEAGREISRVCHNLWANNVEHLLPPGAVLIQISAIMTHLSRVLSQQKKAGLQNDSLRPIFYSLKVCETLQAAHPGVDGVMEFLKTVLNAAKIEVVKDGDLKIVDLLHQKEKNVGSIPNSCSLQDLQSTNSSASAGQLVRGEQCSGKRPLQVLREHLTRSVNGRDVLGSTAELAAEDSPPAEDFRLVTYSDDLLCIDVDLAGVFGDAMAQEEIFGIPLSTI